jgi:hypothetical protein
VSQYAISPLMPDLELVPVVAGGPLQAEPGGEGFL